MFFVRRARIPVSVLPADLVPAAVDPLEPVRLCDVAIEGERIVAVAPSRPEATGGHDAGGAVMFPAFVDAHVHLDKTHTWFRAPNRSGTFWEALETLAKDKDNWSADDLRRRAGFALRSAWAHGTRIVRTHLDSSLPWGATNHAVMAELRTEWAGRIELQTVSLCGGERIPTEEGEAIADLAVRHGASALGGFIQMSPGLATEIEALLRQARERGLGVDLHVDENGEPAAEVLRAVAEAVLRTEFPHPVVCGHCCSLAVQAPERQRETIARVRAARIGVVSLPLCNLYLQDRRTNGFPRTPRWRGLTLVHDLLDAGVPVACASDNVRDAFHAHGDYDMAEIFTQSVRLAHLDQRLGDAVRAVTTGAAEIVGRPQRARIAPGSPANLVVFGAKTFSALLSRRSDRQLIDGERVHRGAAPDYAELEDLAGVSGLAS